MNHLLVGMLVLCTLSMVLCQTEEDSAEFNRCRRHSPSRNRNGGSGGGSRGDGPTNSNNGGGPAGSRRGRGPPIPQECKDFMKVFRAKNKSMRENKEIGSCPEPKSCEECWQEDYAKVMSQLQEPTEECKALFNEFKERFRNRTTTPQP